MNYSIFKTDYYQFTMSLAYLIAGKANETTGFESFIRHIKKDVNPIDECYIFSGSEEVYDFIKKVEEEINDENFFDSFWNIVEKTVREEKKEEFYQIAKDNFERMDKVFEYTIIPEGSVVKPYVPVFQFKGPKMIGQMIETKITNIVNGQTGFRSFACYGKNEILSSLADILFPNERNQTAINEYETKIRDRAIEYRKSTSKVILEAGYRRAPNEEIAIMASKIAMEEGWNGTSNVAAYTKGYVDINAIGGTMAHAFIMSFEDEIEAFKVWNDIYPNSTILVDTYDTIEAVKKLIDYNIKPSTVRIDSGNLKEMSYKVREILDNANWTDVKIFISGDITPDMLKEFEEESVPFDITMAGTKYVNIDEMVHVNAGFVYKIVEYEKNGKRYFPIKKATGKSNYPGLKAVHFNGDISVNIKEDFGFYGNPKSITKSSKVTFEGF